MSLFGQTSQPSNTSSLFNTAQGTNQQQGSSLFSGLGSANQATQPSSTGGLFANLNTSAPQQPATSQATSNSLFGGLGSNQNQSQQNDANQNAPASGSGSLFGRIPGANTSQAPASTQGGLFGSIGATQSTQQLPTQAPTGGSSLFGASLLNNAQGAGQTQPQAPQLPLQQSQNGTTSSTTAHFRYLVERGNKRKDRGDSNQFGELPKLQLGLGDISGKLRNLGSGGLRNDRGTDSRARDLLAASGVPRGSTLRDLNSFRASTGSLPPPQPSTYLDTDIESHIEKLQAKSTADMFQEAMDETNKEYEAFLEESIHINWEETRRRVHEHLGIVKPTEHQTSNEIGSPAGRGAFGRSSQQANKGSTWRNGASFAASGMSKSILGSSINRGSVRGSLFTDVAGKATAAGIPPLADDPFLRSKQEKYASKVKELNSARKEEKTYPIIERFANVELEAGNDTPQHLIDAYKTLKEIVKEQPNITDPSELGAVRERQYAKDYLDETPNSGKSIAIKKQILEGSRRFLEESFFSKLEDAVERNPREANLGGIPSKINKVRAYLRIRAARKDLGGENAELQMLGDDYCWALLYHLLRCGLVQEAAGFVAENERALKAMDRHFGQYMTAYARDPERRLPREMQSRINSEYSQRARLAPENSIDPYRMACYKVVGRCDLAHKQFDGINATVDDWLWLLFSLAREVNRVEEAAGEYFGLDEARGLIETIGQRHFAASSEGGLSYATYFLMQILAGLFEKAVAYLYPHNYIAAVHFAIALDYYGLLKVSDISVSDSDLLTTNSRGSPQISFGRMLGYYTRDFRMARAEAATDYIVLICLNADLPGAAGESQAGVCQEALRDLVLETRDFAMLLGDIQQNGQRIPGAIETRLPLLKLDGQEDFLKRLTMQAASVADDTGRITDAVLLYHLAEEYDNVVIIINRALSEALSVELGQDPMRLQPLKPRTTAEGGPQGAEPKQQRPSKDVEYSQSLTSVDDPVVLAKNLVSLYTSNALYLRRIRQANRDACGQLLSMSDARKLLEAGRTAAALDVITGLDVLPMQAGGNVSVIRLAAQNFNVLPQVVARNIGSLLLWTITCLGRERQNMQSSAFQANQQRADALLQGARDLMVFAGLVRYKLPADVFEVLARAGQNVGA